MELVKEWLLRELKRRVKKERSKNWVEEEVQFLEKEDYLEVFKKMQSKNQFTDNTFDDFELEQKLLTDMVVKEKFKPLFSKVKKLKFIDMLGLYHQLFEKTEKKGKRLPDQWEHICILTTGKLNKQEILYEDAAPFVYLQDLIEGRRSNTGIRHIFIDEAQDYSPFQFAFIQRLFPYSKVTMLGDFNQAIFSGATGSETVLSEHVAEGDEVDMIILKKTYRSTREIVEFTSSLIEGGEKIEPFNRTGKKPTIKQAGKGMINGLLIEKINTFQNQGYRTIAVICRTADESKTVFEALKHDLELHLIEKGTVSYEKGILVIPSYLAKGIEFDAVILHDSSEYQSESERKLFYTVCTRAMHELHMFISDGISPLMNNVSNKLYDLE
jgi:DNA helicase-2/ATP-dependent DNA helicase PcrA